MILPDDWSVHYLMAVDHKPMADWIQKIPFDQWPQQCRERDGSLRPAMVNDLRWHNFGGNGGALHIAGAIMQKIIYEDRHAYDAIVRLGGFEPIPNANNYMLSVVMPGRSIDPHVDRMPANWRFRVHVPLVADDLSQFIVDGEPHTMRPGEAYLVNVQRRHEVRNGGDYPRIHFMFDVFT